MWSAGIVYQEECGEYGEEDFRVEKSKRVCGGGGERALEKISESFQEVALFERGDEVRGEAHRNNNRRNE